MRNDKLIVDMNQKNEVCQILIAQTDDRIQDKGDETSKLEVLLKEVKEVRACIGTENVKTEDKIKVYKAYQAKKLE